MPYKDTNTQRAYQREWVQNRRQAWLSEHGPCVECGSTKQLEIHHKDKSTKINHRLWSWQESRRNAELEKCEVLCKPCHDRKTSESRGIPPHGTNSRYTSSNLITRCRCPACREAHRIANCKKYRTISTAYWRWRGSIPQSEHPQLVGSTCVAGLYPPGNLTSVVSPPFASLHFRTESGCESSMNSLLIDASTSAADIPRRDARSRRQALLGVVVKVGN